MDAIFESPSALRSCDEGRLLADGTPDEIQRNQAVTGRLSRRYARTGTRMSLLEIEGINTYYGDSHILFDVSMDVARNEVVALLGRNGAGKPQRSGLSWAC